MATTTEGARTVKMTICRNATKLSNELLIVPNCPKRLKNYRNLSKRLNCQKRAMIIRLNCKNIPHPGAKYIEDRDAKTTRRAAPDQAL